MFQPLSQAIEARGEKTWDESDTRHFIQRWLREHVGVSHIYCEKFQGGVAHVRVLSPAVRQTVQLVAYDLQHTLKEVGGVQLKEVRV